MAKYCPITKRKPMFGNKRSHALNTSKRRWNLNLQTFTIEYQGQRKKIVMSARAYRTLKKKNIRL